MSPEGFGGSSGGEAGLGSGAGTPCLCTPCPSLGTWPSSLYTLAWLAGCPLWLHGAMGPGLGSPGVLMVGQGGGASGLPELAERGDFA